jgi:hypothetical protein
MTPFVPCRRNSASCKKGKLVNAWISYIEPDSVLTTPLFFIPTEVTRSIYFNTFSNTLITSDRRTTSAMAPLFQYLTLFALTATGVLAMPQGNSPCAHWCQDVGILGRW